MLYLSDLWPEIECPNSDTRCANRSFPSFDVRNGWHRSPLRHTPARTKPLRIRHTEPQTLTIATHERPRRNSTFYDASPQTATPDPDAMRANTTQKAYDEAFLACSTAVYFEGQVSAQCRADGVAWVVLTLFVAAQRERSPALVENRPRSHLLPQCPSEPHHLSPHVLNREGSLRVFTTARVTV